MKTRLVPFFLILAVAVFAAGPASAADASFVVEAVTVLEENYVDQLDRCELFNAAIDGLSESLKIIKAPHKLEKIPKEKCQYAQDRFVIEFSRAEAFANGKLTETQLAFESVHRMAYSLKDSHVAFLPPERSLIEEKVLYGEPLYAGIGAGMHKDGDGIYVKEVFEDTPAHGFLKQFDKILAVDGHKVTKDMKVEDVIGWIRGKEDTEVSVVVERKGEKSPLVLIMRRAAIKAPVTSSQMLPGKVGYLKIHSFSKLATGLESILKMRRLLYDEGMRALILDLRGNPGGLIFELRIVAGHFLPSDTVLFRTRNRNKEEELYHVRRLPLQPFLARDKIPMVVLVDEDSASSSEILSAALQEYCRATIVGVKTAVAVDIGRVIGLSEDTSLIVTQERVITPKGVLLGKTGVMPDVVITTAPGDYALGRDPQLLRALEIIKSKLK